MSASYVGIMSGTSLDGIDAVLVDFTEAGLQVRGHSSLPFEPALKATLLALNAPGANELHTAALAGNALARLYAHAVHALLSSCQVSSNQVRAIGAHGQTVRHRPQEFDGCGYTLQINQPALLAELCGIDVVADFRSRDLAAGGQGAPLVPPFHQAFFGTQAHDTAVLNIGGISNITPLPADTNTPLRGFDCGPGNVLMDAWCHAHTGQTFDVDGQWAASASVHAGLLAQLQDDPFFSKPAPKSTGRDLFHWDWLQTRLQGFTGLPPNRVQATLTELTAWACAHGVRESLSHCKTLIVCGGGALNTTLMHRLAGHLPDCQVQSSDTFGLPPLQVEATAFAWLAQQTIHRKTSSVESVTGAKGARILGAVYPA